MKLKQNKHVYTTGYTIAQKPYDNEHCIIPYAYKHNLPRLRTLQYQTRENYEIKEKMQFLKESARSCYLPKIKLKQGLDTFTVEVQIMSPLMDMNLASLISLVWSGGCPPIEPAGAN